MKNGKSYSELITIPTFEERFKYLQLKGSVGKDTFGHDRYLNQILYNSQEWKTIRNKIIIRDNGCDLACEGFEIYGQILIHHINPIFQGDISNHHHIRPSSFSQMLISLHNSHTFLLHLPGF